MEFLEPVMAYIDPIWAWLMAGVDASRHGDAGGINWTMLGIQMGVIAIVMALLMPNYAAILIFTVVGTIVHVIVDQVLPIIQDGASFAVPDINMELAQYLAFVGLGYFVALTVLYTIKAIVLPSR